MDPAHGLLQELCNTIFACKYREVELSNSEQLPGIFLDICQHSGRSGLGAGRVNAALLFFERESRPYILRALGRDSVELRGELLELFQAAAEGMKAEKGETLACGNHRNRGSFHGE